MATGGAADVHYDTFLSWLVQFPEFSDQVVRAEAEAEDACAQAIHSAIGTDWRAAEAWLKRRRREEWGDNQLDDLEEGDWGEVDWDEAEGIYVIGDDEIEWGSSDFMAFALGTTLTVAAMNSLTSGPEPACTMRSVVVGGDTYYNCGPSWYVKTYTNGELAYAVVAPPPGY